MTAGQVYRCIVTTSAGGIDGDWALFEEAPGGAALSTVIDSSAGATVETLPAATGSGEIRYFVNHDVTNSATLAVQAGESLQGVTDGTFLFSAYAAGTQFRVDDKAAGEWVVSVAGAGEQTDLHRASMIETAGAITELDDNPFVFDSTRYAVGIASDPANGAFTIAQDGLYEFSFTCAWDEDDGSASALFAIEINGGGFDVNNVLCATDPSSTVDAYNLSGRPRFS